MFFVCFFFRFNSRSQSSFTNHCIPRYMNWLMWGTISLIFHWDVILLRNVSNIYWLLKRTTTSDKCWYDSKKFKQLFALRLIWCDDHWCRAFITHWVSHILLMEAQLNLYQAHSEVFLIWVFLMLDLQVQNQAISANNKCHTWWCISWDDWGSNTGPSVTFEELFSILSNWMGASL